MNNPRQNRRGFSHALVDLTGVFICPKTGNAVNGILSPSGAFFTGVLSVYYPAQKRPADGFLWLLCIALRNMAAVVRSGTRPAPPGATPAHPGPWTGGFPPELDPANPSRSSTISYQDLKSCKSRESCEMKSPDSCV